MPNLDGTGPNGNGPKTGGQMGDCPGAAPQDKPFDGRGMGQGGRGQGRQGLGSRIRQGFRRRFGR